MRADAICLVSSSPTWRAAFLGGHRCDLTVCQDNDLQALLCRVSGEGRLFDLLGYAVKGMTGWGLRVS